MSTPIMPPWHVTAFESGHEIKDAYGNVVCWMPKPLEGVQPYPPELITVVPDMLHLVNRLVDAGSRIRDISPTMASFVDEAEKIKGKLV